jgi:hypothetical protein
VKALTDHLAGHFGDQPHWDRTLAAAGAVDGDDRPS